MSETRQLPMASLVVRLLRPLLGEKRAREFVGSNYAVATLVYYSFRTQHGKALLGLVWALLTPLLFIVVYVPVLGAMGMSASADSVLGEGRLGFPIYVVAGFVTWTAFTYGLQNGSTSLVDNPDVVHHSPIPLSILPLVKVLNGMVGLLVSGVILSIGLAFVGRFPGIRLLIFPGLLILLAMFTLGLALLCSALAVFFRDVLQILNSLLLIEFFAVPLIYLPTQIPEGYRYLLDLNPLSPFMELAHATFIRQYPISWHMLGLAVLWAVGTYAVGRLVFLRLERNIADYT
ncbi:MAG: ABC transporter permease [Planctomycetes bacterium]|nr:ABC transporter permease [Planctomycetota bacterium]